MERDVFCRDLHCLRYSVWMSSPYSVSCPVLCTCCSTKDASSSRAARTSGSSAASTCCSSARPPTLCCSGASRAGPSLRCPARRTPCSTGRSTRASGCRSTTRAARAARARRTLRRVLLLERLGARRRVPRRARPAPDCLLECLLERQQQCQQVGGGWSPCKCRDARCSTGSSRLSQRTYSREAERSNWKRLRRAAATNIPNIPLVPIPIRIRILQPLVCTSLGPHRVPPGSPTT